MSKSQPRLENPCKKFIEFKSDRGQFFYYDRDTQEQIELSMPIYFVVLDELSTISGYNEANNCGIYANEVHRLSETLRVRTFKGGEKIVGLYADTKDSIKALGGRFTKSVYALLLKGQGIEPELVNFRFHGGSFAAWMEKKANVNSSIIVVKELEMKQKGKNKYQVPVFSAMTLPKEIDERAIEMDRRLQAYLKEYKAQQAEETASEAAIVEEPVIEDKAQSQAPLYEGLENQNMYVGKSAGRKYMSPEEEEILRQETSDLPY